MALKAIEFDELQDVCKYRSECGKECVDDDNYAGSCDSGECPVWSELISSEIEK